jgi:hypothetical protein
MSDQIPTSDELLEIRRWALAYCAADRRRNATVNSPEYSAAIEGDQQARRNLKAVLNASGACCPMGWPDGAAEVLTKLCRILAPHLSAPFPSHFPELEAQIKEHLVAGQDVVVTKGRKPTSRPGPDPKDPQEVIEAIIKERESGTTDRRTIADKVSAKLKLKRPITRGNVHRVLNTYGKSKTKPAH